MIEQICGNCIAYKDGKCHLSPPQVTAHKTKPSIMKPDTITVFHSSFPEVFKWDWCMQFSTDWCRRVEETRENLRKEL